MAIILRGLAFLAALVLMAPQGWCCGAGVHASREQSKEPCCPCQQKHEETPKPVPHPAKDCQCQVDSVASPSEKPAFDLAVVPLVSPLPEPALADPTHHADLDFEPHSPPLQLLHCVWLC
jgi:hypothetical protein